MLPRRGSRFEAVGLVVLVILTLRCLPPRYPCGTFWGHLITSAAVLPSLPLSRRTDEIPGANASFFDTVAGDGGNELIGEVLPHGA